VSSENRNEEDVVVHEYDGIEEYDNKLPRWWLWTLYGAMAFAFVYWAAYQTFGSLDNPRAAFDKEAAVERAKEIERMKAAGPVTGDLLISMSKDQKTLDTGKQVFTTQCAACHKPDGSGNIGPNLTDRYWIHGSKPEDIYKTINDGVLTKGMPVWGPVLGIEKTEAVTAYVLSIANTNVPGGKAPQGELAGL
jgi:cytochrome c oxidase cbb3-type subunit 3